MISSNYGSSLSHEAFYRSTMSTYPQGPNPYLISVSDEQIAFLKAKLEQSRFPDELDEAGWAYGVPLEDVKRLAARWKDGYNWKEHEERLNRTLPQFTVDLPIEGFGLLNIHFVHKRSTVVNSIPLLFVHGCTLSLILFLLTDEFIILKGPEALSRCLKFSRF